MALGAVREKKDHSFIRVLMVDDEPDFIDEITWALEKNKKHGFFISVEKATSFEQASHLAKKGGFDVVLLDLNLPDSQGIDTFKRFQSFTPHLPVVILTGMDDEKLSLGAVHQGAQDYVIKDKLDVRQLVRILQYAIERKKIENEMKRLASFPEEDPFPIIEVASLNTISYVNPAARLRFPDLASLRMSHPLVEGLKNVIQFLKDEGKSVLTRELAVNDCFFEETVAVVNGTDLLRIYVVDITERKRMDKLKDEFVSTVSHELRTPLAIIKGAISNLYDGIAGSLSEPQKRVAGIGKSNIDRLAKIINDLLDLSRLESGKIRIHPRRINPVLLLKEVMAGIKLDENKKHLIIQQVIPDILPSIYADRDMLIQVFNNLLSNALRFSVSKIEMRARVEGPEKSQNKTRGGKNRLTPKGYVVFSVVDDGPGIPTEHLKDVFSKFVQINRPMGGAGYKGTGLGLAICKEIIDHHRGKIWVEKDAAGGSCFYFCVPQYDEEGDVWSSIRKAILDAETRKSFLSLITIRFANVKEIRETHPMDMLEQVIEDISALVCAKALRKADSLYHYLTKDFMIILAEAGKEGAEAIIERLKTLFDDYFSKTTSLKVKPQISYGVAVYPDSALDAERLFELALLDAEEEKNPPKEGP